MADRGAESNKGLQYEGYDPELNPPAGQEYGRGFDPFYYEGRNPQQNIVSSSHPSMQMPQTVQKVPTQGGGNTFMNAMGDRKSVV